jgi:hypothetical protein
MFKKLYLLSVHQEDSYNGSLSDLLELLGRKIKEDEDENEDENEDEDQDQDPSM